MSALVPQINNMLTKVSTGITNDNEVVTRTKDDNHSLPWMATLLIEVSSGTCYDNHADRGQNCYHGGQPCFEVITSIIDDNHALKSVLVTWMATML